MRGGKPCARCFSNIGGRLDPHRITPKDRRLPHHILLFEQPRQGKLSANIIATSPFFRRCLKYVIHDPCGLVASCALHTAFLLVICEITAGSVMFG